jgi:hypothetical protein
VSQARRRRSEGDGLIVGSSNSVTNATLLKPAEWIAPTTCMTRP